jgi:hypothetical protein
MVHDYRPYKGVESYNLKLYLYRHLGLVAEVWTMAPVDA